MESILGSIAGSAIVLAAAAFILKQYWEKLLKYSFDRRLQKFAAELGVQTSLDVDVNKRRIEDYTRISELIKANRKSAERTCSAQTDVAAASDQWKEQTEALETAVYRSVLLLKADGLYDPVHTHKNAFVVLRNYVLDKNAFLHDGDADKANGLRETIDQRLRDINAASDHVIELLLTAVSVPRSSTAR